MRTPKLAEYLMSGIPGYDLNMPKESHTGSPAIPKSKRR
jgi:hypothetical protein